MHTFKCAGLQAKLGGQGAKGETAAGKVKGAVDNAIGGN